jgi:hypothetical protein
MSDRKKCFACEVTERLVLAICCKRPCCPNHRYGTGSHESGFTCSDHPFGMAYEPPAEQAKYVTYRWSGRLMGWLRKKKQELKS